MTEARPPSDIFAERLKAAREQRRWSQSELGAKAGMPPSSIAHFETGSRKPSFDNLRRLANALTVTTDYLLGRVEEADISRDADPLFRDVGKLSEHDRELAREFLGILMKRDAARRKGET